MALQTLPAPMSSEHSMTLDYSLRRLMSHDYSCAALHCMLAVSEALLR